ncbi:MAG: hypothetical protein ACI8QD_000989 [Cyclobacteriaceae bacterium]|jgi:hypothetical protein
MPARSQDQPLNTWRHFPAYTNAKSITRANSSLFITSQNGFWKLEDDNIETISTAAGFSDISIGTVKFLEEEELLLIGYNSGAIDLLSSTRIVSDVSLRDLRITSKKSHYDQTFTNGKIYLAGELGVVEFNLDRRRAQDIYQNIGPAGTAIICYQINNLSDSIYAFCNQGLFVGATSDNLLDFNNWTQKIDQRFGPQTTSENTEEEIYFSDGTPHLFRLRAGDNLDTILLGNNITSIAQALDGVLATTIDSIYTITRDEVVSQEKTAFLVNDIEAIGNDLWLATQNNGLINATTNTSANPSGMANDQIENVSVSNNTTFFFHGDSSGDRYSVYQDGALRGNRVDLVDKPVDQFTFQGQDYLLDQLRGIYSINDRAFLPNPAQSGQFTEALIDKNRLYLGLEDSSTPILFSDNLNDWISVNGSTLTGNSAKRLQVSQGGVIYFINDRMELIAIDPTSDLIRRISSIAGISGTLTDFGISLEDELLICSSRGLYAFNDATFIFEDEDAQKVVISDGNLVQNDDFSAMTVDSGNRVWVATSDGLWQYDSGFDNQIGFFSSENSDLPDNRILRLDFQSETGLLWVSTDKGVASLQTDAGPRFATHQKVSLFPNPYQLRQNNGFITVNGLVDQATIKITSLTGKYVNEIASNGSRASWNLQDFQGNTVSPGIYLFFSSNDTGDETLVAKLLIEL